MLFKKDEDAKKDIRDIKHAVEDAGEPLAAGEMPMGRGNRSFYPAGEPQEEQSAPLFVKVEKYREVVSNIQEMKLFVAGVKDIFSILQEIEHIRGEALNVMKVTVQRLEKSVVEMDAELLRPRGVNISPFPHGEEEARHIESSLSELQKQLIELKHELQGMR